MAFSPVVLLHCGCDTAKKYAKAQNHVQDGGIMALLEVKKSKISLAPMPAGSRAEETEKPAGGEEAERHE